jgi:hypothetical protein
VSPLNPDMQNPDIRDPDVVNPSEVVHRGALDLLVAHAAPRCQTLAELLAHLPGVYPGDVIVVLERLAALQLVDTETRARLTQTPHDPAEVTDAASEPWEQLLPAPHPLDYDWRWAQHTTRQLLAHCLALSRPGETIALLGTPTLLHTTLTSWQPRKWVLLEASPATTTALATISPDDVIHCDLARDDLPALDARVVVADPPWYPEHTRVFLWAAAQLSRAGATVLLAQPAVATRPGVLAERAELLAYARATGLYPVRIRSGALAYTCPPFERRALHTEGLSRLVPATWRRGDLIELRRTATRTAARPTLHNEEVWSEVALSGVHIRFRLDRPAADGSPADPRLRDLIDGDVLTSVSRRDPIRRHVAVWTEGNRIFGCHSADLLAVIAAAVADHHPISQAIESHLGRRPDRTEQPAIDHALAQLAELAELEAKNHNAAPAATTIGRLPDQSAGRQADPYVARSAS